MAGRLHGKGGSRWAYPLPRRTKGSTRRFTCSLMVLTIAALLASCLGRPEVPDTYDLRNVRLVVWDALQVKFPDSADYSEEVSRVIQEFCRETGATVDLRYAERREILDLLTGTYPKDTTEVPHLVFSGEYPVLSDRLEDVSHAVDPDIFLDAAANYWTRDGKLLGIPAFIHWTGTAVKYQAGGEHAPENGEGEGRDLEEGEAQVPRPSRTAYWTDSPLFLRCALDVSGMEWGAETVLQYAEWVRENYGSFHDDPLSAWEHGLADALYPVNPYLYKWLEAREEEGSGITIVPPGTHFDDDRFYYTVPAYLVLCEGGAEKAAAVELGRRLAKSLGRWAARTLACVPALVDDMSIFNLESGFDYAERKRIWDSVVTGEAKAPEAAEYLQVVSLAGALEAPLREFLSGRISRQDLEGLIHEALSRNTRP